MISCAPRRPRRRQHRRPVRRRPAGTSAKHTTCYGLRFTGHEPLRPLLDHHARSWRPGPCPRPGHDTYQVAVGPIHAGVIESGHFRFHVVGDRILHLDLRLFYKHRGLEARRRGPPTRRRRWPTPSAPAPPARSPTRSPTRRPASSTRPGARPRAAPVPARCCSSSSASTTTSTTSPRSAPVSASRAGTMAFAALKERAQRLNAAPHRPPLPVRHRARRPRAHCGSAQAARARGARASYARCDARTASDLARAARSQPRSRTGLAASARSPREDAIRLGAVGPGSARGRRRQRHTQRKPATRLRRLRARRGPERRPATSPRALTARARARRSRFAILDQLLARQLAPGGVQAERRRPAGSASAASRARAARRSASSRRDGAPVGAAASAHRLLRQLARARPRLRRKTCCPDFPLINKSFELCYACADR